MNKIWIVIALCLLWNSCRNPISTEAKAAIQDSIMVTNISQDSIIQKSIECKDSNFLCFSLGKYKMYLGEIFSAGTCLNFYLSKEEKTEC